MSRAGRSETSTQDANFQKGNNHLLVIGINQYQDSNIPNLRNARTDAEAVAELLQAHYGFEQCTTLYDGKADHESITDTLEALPNRIQVEDNLLIYFAGHGHYNKTAKIGYLLPADAKWGKPHTYLSNSNLLDYVRAINSRHTFLILDSCFSGALFRSMRAIGDRWKDNLEHLPSRWALVSGLIEEVSDGFYDDTSPFAKCLLTYLQNAPDTFLVSDLIQYVKNAVPNNARQQPYAGILFAVGDQMGEMIFRRIGNEELDWKNIANSQNIDDFVAYLRKHGYQSYYAKYALAQIKTLEDIRKAGKEIEPNLSLLIQVIQKNKDNPQIKEWVNNILKISDNFTEEELITSNSVEITDEHDNVKDILINEEQISVKVFMSYSHDNQAHIERVLSLADRMIREGVDVIIDEYDYFNLTERWWEWMQQKIELADFVLVICTNKYRERFENKTKDLNSGKGVYYEGAIISDTLYNSYGHNRKFLPILFEEDTIDNIPIFLRGYNYYFLYSGYEKLYRFLTRQPARKRPERGEIRRLDSES